MKKCWPAVIILFSSFLAGAQRDSIHPSGYTIDSTLRKKIDSKKLEFPYGAIMDISWIENDTIAGWWLSGEKMPCLAVYSISNDTLHVSLMPALTPGAGIVINFFNNTAIIRHIMSPKSRVKIFKHKIDDPEYESFILVKGISKLILTKPVVAGEPIEGYLEFESENFYQKHGDGNTKRAYKARGYFKAKPV